MVYASLSSGELLKNPFPIQYEYHLSSTRAGLYFEGISIVGFQFSVQGAKVGKNVEESVGQFVSSSVRRFVSLTV